MNHGSHAIWSMIYEKRSVTEVTDDRDISGSIGKVFFVYLEVVMKCFWQCFGRVAITNCRLFSFFISSKIFMPGQRPLIIKNKTWNERQLHTAHQQCYYRNILLPPGQKRKSSRHVYVLSSTQLYTTLTFTVNQTSLPVTYLLSTWSGLQIQKKMGSEKKTTGRLVNPQQKLSTLRKFFCYFGLLGGGKWISK